MSAFTMRSAWTPLTVVLTIVGFMVDWRIGVAMIVYVIWGDRLKAEGRRLIDKFRSGGGFDSFRMGGFGAYGGFRPTGNAAFDAHRQSMLRRLEDQRRALIEEQRAFEEFMANLSQARDKEEFDKFMAERDRTRMV